MKKADLLHFITLMGLETERRCVKAGDNATAHEIWLARCGLIHALAINGKKGLRRELQEMTECDFGENGEPYNKGLHFIKNKTARQIVSDFKMNAALVGALN